MTGDRVEPRGRKQGRNGERPCKPERGSDLVKMNHQGVQGVCVCVCEGMRV